MTFINLFSHRLSKHILLCSVFVIVGCQTLAFPFSLFTKGPDVNALAALALTQAKDRTVRELTLSGEKLFYLSYKVPSQVASPGIGMGGVMSSDREFHELYKWDGKWNRVFNIYEWAQALLPADEIGTIVDGKPQSGTALITASLSPVQVRESSSDFLVLEIGYTAGPLGVQHYTPTIAVLSLKGGWLHTVWSRNFDVRGSIVQARGEDGNLHLVMPTELDDDAACCPSGWEHIWLAPDPVLELREEGECKTRQNSICTPAGAGYASGSKPTASPTPAPKSALRPTSSPKAIPPATASNLVSILGTPQWWIVPLPEGNTTQGKLYFGALIENRGDAPVDAGVSFRTYKADGTVFSGCYAGFGSDGPGVYVNIAAHERALATCTRSIVPRTTTGLQLSWKLGDITPMKDRSTDFQVLETGLTTTASSGAETIHMPSALVRQIGAQDVRTNVFFRVYSKDNIQLGTCESLGILLESQIAQRVSCLAGILLDSGSPRPDMIRAGAKPEY